MVRSLAEDRGDQMIMNKSTEVAREVQDELVVLWSIQDRAVTERLRTGTFTASIDFVPSHRQAATRWMADQMRERGFQLELADAPIWALLERP